MPNLLRPEFLRLGRKAQEGIDGALGEQLHGFGRGVCDPDDVMVGVQADIGHDAREENMLGRAQPRHRHGLPLELTERADRPLPKSSKQPTWAPARKTISSPAST
jgi:hypothetical protein